MSAEQLPADVVLTDALLERANVLAACREAMARAEVGTCATCARWTTPEWKNYCPACAPGGSLYPDAECENTPFCRGLGTCGAAKHRQVRDGHPPTQARNLDWLRQVEVSDASDYRATLHTAPTFGCLLWEPADV